MKWISLPLDGAFRIEPELEGDHRGFFARLFCAEEFSRQGLTIGWAQCNMSLTAKCGTIRGLHFQRRPSAELKLVRCTRGAVFDVMVDLRMGSATYGKWYGTKLSQKNRGMVLIPEGFAHGFQSLTNDVEMLYFHSKPYCVKDEGGLRWDDNDLDIQWPLNVTEISLRDRAFPYLDALEPIVL